MATPSVGLASQAESWDDDNDFDWTDSQAAPIDLASTSGVSVSKLVGGVEQSQTSTRPTLEDDDLDIEEGFGDFDAGDEEEVDTLKVSDLNKETLAQLAAYAKRKVNQTTTDISQLDAAALPPLVHRLGPTSTLPMQKGAFDRDWDEDLEIPDTLSIESLKPRRYASFQSDGDFEVPSLASTSGSSTSGSHRSSSGPLVVPSHRRNASGATRSPHSSASSSAHLSPIAAHRRHHDKFDDDADESDFVLSDNVQMLRLGPQIVRQPSQDLSDADKRRQRNAMWGVDDAEDGSLAVAHESRHRAQHSISSVKGSDKSSEGEHRDGAEQEEFDDLDFSAIALPTTDVTDESSRAASKPATSLADRLRARLDARKANGEESSSGSACDAAVLETDAVSGLIITDDMDLSPSRLRARNLSDRLREAARSRRRRQDAKRKNAVETSAGASQSGEARRPTTEGQMRFPSGPLGAAHTEGRALGLRVQSKTGSLAGGRQVANEQGGAAQIVSDQRQGGLRPQTPVALSNAISGRATSNGRVTPQQAGIMSYALPTAASLARQSLTNPRSEAWHEDTPALRSPSSQSPTHAMIPTAPRFMRQPRNARNYGDGRELDRIEDLLANEASQPSHRADVGKQQTSSQGTRRAQEPETSRAPPSSGNTTSDLSAAPLTTSSRKGGGRSRRKKLPFLIRNLGGASKSAKMVGEMRWNPTLKCWEGNDKEGREFEVAIRGTGRPALITPFILSASSMDSNVPLSPLSPAPRPVSRSLSSSILSPELRTPATAGMQVVGDMMFDPVQMCWVRQDGEEETDPFDAQDEDGDGDEDALAPDECQSRQIRQRSVSAELMPASLRALRAQHSTDQIDGGRNRGAKMGQVAAPLGLAPMEVEHMIAKDVASASSEVPLALREVIPLQVWRATTEAQQRHQRQMAGFLPCTTATRNQRGTARTAANDRRGGGKVAAATMRTSSAAQNRRHAAISHLYFIRDRNL